MAPVAEGFGKKHELEAEFLTTDGTTAAERRWPMGK
jgi:hypothetical protein